MDFFFVEILQTWPCFPPFKVYLRKKGHLEKKFCEGNKHRPVLNERAERSFKSLFLSVAPLGEAEITWRPTAAAEKAQVIELHFN